jgi:hypothetical protein
MRKEVAAQPAQQEPVAELLKQSRKNFDHNFGKAGQGWADWIYADLLELLTTPPAAQRQWVGLTNKEKRNIVMTSDTPSCVLMNAEAKLKEKNT